MRAAFVRFCSPRLAAGDSAPPRLTLNARVEDAGSDPPSTSESECTVWYPRLASEPG